KPRAELSRTAERPAPDAAAAIAGVRRLDRVVGGGALAAPDSAETGAAPGGPGPERGPRAPRAAAQLQRRAADRRPLQTVDAGDPESPERGRRALEAADRLRERPHVRPERGHAARRRQGVPPHAAKRGGECRAACATPRAGRGLQSSVKSQP